MIAYITTGYPALSHTFIVREVEALRRRGVQISTTSVHRSSANGLLSEEHRRAFATTHALLPPRWREVVRAHLYALVRHPLALLSTLALSLQLGRHGLRGRLRQVFYFGEAVTAWNHWRKLGIRHVHAHFVAVPADIALLASHLGRRAQSGPQSWSVTVHGLIELWDVQVFRLAEKIRRADAVVCVSDFTRSQLMAMVEERHWPKLRVIHCGVRRERYRYSDPPTRERSRVLCVARLVPEKGHSVLLGALAELVAGGVDVELELVGDGPTRGRLERLASELGIEDRIVFAGAVGQDEIAGHYEAATVVCLPSFCEAVPVVLMEAMACGRPVIATAVAGVRELVRDGETGLLVAPARTDELAHAIARLLADGDLRRELARAGRRHVERCYDVDTSAGELSDLFSQLLGDRQMSGRLDGAPSPVERAPDPAAEPVAS